MARYNEVRISADGNQLAWHRPDLMDAADDAQPWLVIDEDPVVTGVEHEWYRDEYVADWTVLTPRTNVQRAHRLLAQALNLSPENAAILTVEELAACVIGEWQRAVKPAADHAGQAGHAGSERTDA